MFAYGVTWQSHGTWQKHSPPSTVWVGHDPTQRQQSSEPHECLLLRAAWRRTFPHPSSVPLPLSLWGGVGGDAAQGGPYADKVPPPWEEMDGEMDGEGKEDIIQHTLHTVQLTE